MSSIAIFLGDGTSTFHNPVGAFRRKADYTHDIRLLGETLDKIVISRPAVYESHTQNLCLDAGYTGSKIRPYTAHIRPKGEECKEIKRNPDFKARDWVVEAAHSFFNRFRKLLVHFEE